MDTVIVITIQINAGVTLANDLPSATADTDHRGGTHGDISARKCLLK